MGLLQRIKYSIEADLNHFFDKKEEKNPISMLNQYIREAEKQTEETGEFLERQEQLKIKLQQELQQAKEMYTKREKQVGLATASGEQDLVEFTAQEMTTYARRMEALEDSITQVDKELFELQRKFEEMKHKIKDMKVRQLQLMGKENVIRANTQMNRILDPETNGGAEQRLDSFESMENYINRLENKINHKHEITSMEQRLTDLEKKNANEDSPQ